VGEQNNIDALYATLSLKRNTVVSGRYLFSLIINISYGLISYVFSFAVMTVMQKDFDIWESFIYTVIMAVICSIVQAVQLPMLSKLGYMKVKFLTYLPLAGIPLAIILFSTILKNVTSPEQANDLLERLTDLFDWFAGNPVIAVTVIAVIWLAIMALSYKISISGYNKREF
jgi:hypothetical protein